MLSSANNMKSLQFLAFATLAVLSFSIVPAASIHGAPIGGPVGGPSGGGPTGGDPIGGPCGGGLVNPLGCGTDLMTLLTRVLNVVIQLGVVVLTLMIVYCGFLFVTAQGNPEALSKAKSALLWTVIGGAILLGAQGIASGVGATINAVTGSP